MRIWYKCWLQKTSDEILTLTKDRSFADHARAIGGYDSGPEYASRDSFWKAFFSGRYLFWDEFLRKHLTPGKRVLSIASGRCINESRFLALPGYAISCSDLEIIPSYPETKKLFGEFPYFALDIVQNRPPESFDQIVCLSLIYVFDDAQLERFFKNVHAGLKPGGELLLDSAGSEDKLLSRLFDRYLILEAHLIHYACRILGKPYRMCRQPAYGFKRSDADIVRMAARNGLRLLEIERFDDHTETSRSYLLSRLARSSSWVRRWLPVLGRRLPYIRMFRFQSEAG